MNQTPLTPFASPAIQKPPQYRKAAARLLRQRLDEFKHSLASELSELKKPFKPLTEDDAFFLATIATMFVGVPLALFGHFEGVFVLGAFFLSVLGIGTKRQSEKIWKAIQQEADNPHD